MHDMVRDITLEHRPRHCSSNGIGDKRSTKAKINEQSSTNDASHLKITYRRKRRRTGKDGVLFENVSRGWTKKEEAIEDAWFEHPMGGHLW